MAERLAEYVSDLRSTVMPDLLIDYARDTVGLKMGGLQAGRHCRYTTDADKAQMMREAGAAVTSILGRQDGVSAAWPPYTFPSWEISFLVGSERAT